MTRPLFVTFIWNRTMPMRLRSLPVAAIILLLFGLIASVDLTGGQEEVPVPQGRETDYPPPISHNDSSSDWEDRDTGIVYRNINYFVFPGNSLTVSKEQGVLKNDVNWRVEPPWETLTTSLLDSPNAMPEYGFSTLYVDGSFIYTPYPWSFDRLDFSDSQDSFPE